MIPKHIRLSGFLSYREEVEIGLGGIHLACIAGANGAGKSALLDAITWSLFGQARKRDDSLINAASDAARVVFEFFYEGNTYRVQRSKQREQPTLLEFHMQVENGRWRPLTARTVRETEAVIRDTLHLDYDTFVSAAFFLQGRADQFTQQRPADRKRILGSILGLDSWETYRQVATARRRNDEKQIAVLDDRLHLMRAELETQDERGALVERLQGELAQVGQQHEQQEAVVSGLQRTVQAAQTLRERDEALRAQLAATQAEQGEVQTHLAERHSEITGYQAILERQEDVKRDYQRWEAARSEADHMAEASARAHELDLRGQTLLSEERERRLRLDHERNTLEGTRSRFLAVMGEGSALRSRLQSEQEAIEAATARIRRKQALETEHQEALRARADAAAENPRLCEEMDEIKDRIHRLEALSDTGCPLCEQDLSPQVRQNLSKRLTQQGRQLGDRYRENKRLLAEAETTVHQQRQELQELASAQGDLKAHTLKAEYLEEQLERIEADRQELRSSVEPALAQVTSSLESGSYASDLRNQLLVLDAERSHLGYEPEAHAAVRQTLKDLQDAPAEMRKLEQADPAVRSLSREISDLERQRSGLERQIRRLQQEVETASVALSQSQAEASRLPEAERLLSDLRRRENDTRRRLGAAEQSLSELASLRASLAELETEREDAAMRVQYLRMLESAFGHRGVPALLIEQALPEIAARANEILELLSDGAMSVRFVSQQAYKDQSRDDMRETLDILIGDGQGTRDYSLFSGGERFRVDFAIRLALSKVLAQRAGARLQMLVIDEGFGTQDDIGRQKLVEAVNLVQADFACILVITHIETLKEVFPSRIEVAKTPRGSVVSVC